MLQKIVGKLYSLINKAFARSSLPKFKSIQGKAKIEFPFNIMGEQYISIGANFISRKNLKLRAFDEFNGVQFSPNIEIGDNVQIEHDCHIGCINHITIGKNVLIASGVYISDHMHGNPDYSDIKLPPISRTLSSKGPVIIGDNVWIGERAVILPNVTIGESSIVAANAVVTRNIPSFTIVAGVPAKIIKSIPH
jgi:acetyltransferase-like isoleucine patch superfamily enzyme